MLFPRQYLVLLCVFRLTFSDGGDEIAGNPDGGGSLPGGEPPTKKEFEIVSLENFGQIEGFLEKSTNGNQFYSFLGIPYAKPPTGTRRFQNPEVHDGWEGVRDGRVAAPPCVQIDLESFIRQPKSSFFGEEDCLYLNIFTPEPNAEKADLPVLVYFHGGNFVSGSALDYEPYDLLDTPLILVVLQYRLGVLGFLTTEDDVIPGNFGLKDQTLALKWIQRYIEQFGGNPLKVTLFGSDAGAASVHYQTLTHKTIGLFKRAILQSGNALCPWATGGVHKEAAHHIGKYFKCFPEESSTGDGEAGAEGGDVTQEREEEPTGGEEPRTEEIAEEEETEEEKRETEEEKRETESEKGEEEDEAKEKTKEESETRVKNEELLQCLQKIEADKLALSVELFYMWSYFPVIFGPYTDGQYLAESPESLLKNARHKRLDLVMGINRDDGSHITNSLFMSEGRRMALRHHFPFVGPISLEFSESDVAPLNMSIKAYDRYAGGLTAEAGDAHNLTKLYTDRHFAVCADKAADLHSTNNQRRNFKLFFYEFNYRGERSTSDQFGLSLGNDWISHGDELYYLFPFNKTKDQFRSEEDEKMRKLMVTMWYFFAQTGNPTPNGTSEFTWEPYTVENRVHLHLASEPFMEEDKRIQVREFWNSLPTRQNIYFNKEYFLNLLQEREREKEGENTQQQTEEGKVEDEHQERSQTDTLENNSINDNKRDEL